MTPSFLSGRGDPLKGSAGQLTDTDDCLETGRPRGGSVPLGREGKTGGPLVED